MVQAVLDQLVVHKFGPVIDIQRAKGERQADADTLERLNNDTAEGLPPRPAWSWALIALGAGLSVLGYWRARSGEQRTLPISRTSHSRSSESWSTTPDTGRRENVGLRPLRPWRQRFRKNQVCLPAEQHAE
jgi:hypothetical protein